MVLPKEIHNYIGQEVCYKVIIEIFRMHIIHSSGMTEFEAVIFGITEAHKARLKKEQF